MFKAMKICCAFVSLEHKVSRGMSVQDINALLDACKVAAGVGSDNQHAAALWSAPLLRD